MIGKDDLGSAILDQLGMPQKNASHNLGWVEITIKQIPQGEVEK